MSTYYIDDVIQCLLDMRKDGYMYFRLFEFYEANEFDSSSCLFFTAEDCGGYGGVSYDGICSVSSDELQSYAYQYHCPPNHRISYDIKIVEFKVK